MREISHNKPTAQEIIDLLHSKISLSSNVLIESSISNASTKSDIIRHYQSNNIKYEFFYGGNYYKISIPSINFASCQKFYPENSIDHNVLTNINGIINSVKCQKKFSKKWIEKSMVYFQAMEYDTQWNVNFEGFLNLSKLPFSVYSKNTLNSLFKQSLYYFFKPLLYYNHDFYKLELIDCVLNMNSHAMSVTDFTDKISQALNVYSFFGLRVDFRNFGIGLEADYASGVILKSLSCKRESYTNTFIPTCIIQIKNFGSFKNLTITDTLDWKHSMMKFLHLLMHTGCNTGVLYDGKIALLCYIHGISDQMEKVSYERGNFINCQALDMEFVKLDALSKTFKYDLLRFMCLTSDKVKKIINFRHQVKQFFKRSKNSSVLEQERARVSTSGFSIYIKTSSYFKSMRLSIAGNSTDFRFNPRRFFNPSIINFNSFFIKRIYDSCFIWESKDIDGYDPWIDDCYNCWGEENNKTIVELTLFMSEFPAVLKFFSVSQTNRFTFFDHNKQTNLLQHAINICINEITILLYLMENNFPHGPTLFDYGFNVFNGVLEKSYTGPYIIISKFHRKTMWEEDRVKAGIIKVFEDLHKLNILHGDVDICNIMFDDNGAPKIIDFDNADQCSLVEMHQFEMEEVNNLDFGLFCFGREV